MSSPCLFLPSRLIAFTTPQNYSHRLSKLISLSKSSPLHLPTISISPTPQTIHNFLHSHSLEQFAGITFTSRTGVSAFSDALDKWDPPAPVLLLNEEEEFVIAALGKDAELLYETGFVDRICPGETRVRVLVPDVSSPSGMVKALGFGHGRRILCPIPTVIDLTEPPVIPDFIKELEVNGWIPVKVQAYETKWMGPKCAETLVNLEENLDAIIFTSTAEVEGLVKSLNEFGWSWGMVRKRWPEIVIAAHGPVTAKGAEMFGVVMDVVSEKFSSFDGIVDALAMRWKGS